MTAAGRSGREPDRREPDREPDTADAPVLVEHLDDSLARITLNRPDKRNAMNRAARRALVEALDACRQGTKVIILTGKGPAFCAGIDLTEEHLSLDESSPDPLVRRSTWRSVQEEIRHHPAIVVAAVNGFALGGGLTLINTADLAVAAETAQIGMPEASFGLYPGLAGPSTQLRVSQKRAAWLVLTAERIDGRTAESWGLVNRAVPLDQLDEAALDLARRLCRYDGVTLQWCKKALWEVPAHITDWPTALEYGESLRAQIQSRTDTVERGLDDFARGQRSPGQGTQQ